MQLSNLTIFFISICALAAGCSTHQQPDAAGGADVLGWPPSDALSRSASDDVPYMRGIDAAQSGGTTAPLGDALVLGPDSAPSWAIYSLQGFGPDVLLDKLELDFAVIPGNPDEGTQLFVGVANYSQEHWEWFEAAEPQFVLDLEDFDDYYSPTGSIHVACVLTGNGSARVFGAHFYRSGAGATVPAPENFAGEVFPGRIELSWDPIAFPDGYRVYRGTLNDFSKASNISGQPLPQAAYVDSNVSKSTQYYYWVTALRGVESAPSGPLQITSSDQALPAPENFQAQVSVGSVTLSWDPVIGAEQYRLQRSPFADFSSVTNINVLDTDQSDNPPANEIYYYRVIARGFEDSLPSNAVSVFIPSADLPAPTNFTVLDERSDGAMATFSWEYGADPSAFNIFIHRDPDFALDGALINQINDIGGNKRQRVFYDLPAEGGTFYCRICARDASGNLGRMTEAISFYNNPAFVFAPQQSLGVNATAPITLATDGSEIYAAYFSNGNVRVARRASETWTAGQDIGLNGSFDFYLDMAQSGGSYVVAAMQTSAGDCWASVGSGSSWSATNIHGDGGTGDDHPVSGVQVCVTSSDNEFGVAHILAGSPQSIIVHARPISGSDWPFTTATTSTADLLDLSIAFKGSDLFLGLSDYQAGDLLLGSRDGSWSMQPINETPGDFICGDNTLGVANGELLTPASDVLNPDLHLYRDGAEGWSREEVITGLGTASFMEMATHEDKVILTFLIPTQSRWYYAYFDGSAWSFSSIVTVGQVPASELKVVMLEDGSPYIVFEDTSNNPGVLRGAPGYFL